MRRRTRHAGHVARDMISGKLPASSSMSTAHAVNCRTEATRNTVSGMIFACVEIGRVSLCRDRPSHHTHRIARQADPPGR